MLISEKDIGKAIKTFHGRSGRISGFDPSALYPVEIIFEGDTYPTRYCKNGRFMMSEPTNADVEWIGERGYSSSDSLEYFRKVMGGIV